MSSFYHTAQDYVRVVYEVKKTNIAAGRNAINENSNFFLQFFPRESTKDSTKGTVGCTTNNSRA